MSNRWTREQGSALVVTLLVSTLALSLGMGLMMLGETQSLAAKTYLEREQSRVAARDAVELAAAWFAAPADRVPRVPPPDEWVTDLRRGDFDGDGRGDAACDGSTASGRWATWPVAEAGSPGADRLAQAVRGVCGTASHPDLMLTTGASPFLAEMAALLGRDILIERLSIHAPPRNAADGRRPAAIEISATVALRRGELVVARTTATARVRLLPSLATGDVIAAGGDVAVEPGGEVRWGRVAADGDIDLPPTDDPSFPFSGLPRQASGQPLPFAPGGVADWNLGTSMRESLLTELMGRTERGAWRSAERVREPALPDPWLSFAAGGVVRAGGRELGPEGQRQPLPYDPRHVDLGADLSHVTAAWSEQDSPSARGRADAVGSLAGALARSGSGVRRFVLDASASSLSEPRWRENGLGVARTAAQWVEDATEPLIASFVTAGLPSPASVTLRSGQGVLTFEARRVVMAAPVSDFAMACQTVTMPGEPFMDLGVDADGDGQIDPGTAGNGRWDADLDDDGVADAGDPRAWLFETQVPPWPRLPGDDRDPMTRDSQPHEPFLNLKYPGQEAAQPSVSVRWDAGMGGSGRPVRDLDGDGAIRPGADRLTTVACDAEGARWGRGAAFAGVIACQGGDVVIGPGASVHGALRATGSVRVETGGRVTFDAGLAREGVPSDMALPSGYLGDVTWTTGLLMDPLLPADEAAGEDAPGEGGADSPGEGGGDSPWRPRGDRPMRRGR